MKVFAVCKCDSLERDYMKFISKKKLILGIGMMVFSIVDILFIVLSGHIGSRLMLAGIVMLAVGISAVHRGRVDISEKCHEQKQYRIATEQASAIALYLIQLGCFGGILATVVISLITDNFGTVFDTIVIVLGTIIIGSYIVESIMAKVILNADSIKTELKDKPKRVIGKKGKIKSIKYRKSAEENNEQEDGTDK